VDEYHYVHKPDQPGDAPQTLYWNPSLATAADGRAKIEFDLPSTAGTFRLRIDARAAGGRVASTQYDLPAGR
jgi:uncharacterized protein YfaS (alpha-2-macroglobulin family)